jgi:hypothetical protein
MKDSPTKSPFTAPQRVWQSVCFYYHLSPQGSPYQAALQKEQGMAGLASRLALGRTAIRHPGEHRRRAHGIAGHQ